MLLMIPMFGVPTALAAPEPVLGPLPDAEYVRSINAKWRGVGVGYANGLWGERYGQGLHLDLPFGPVVGQFFGLRTRGVVDYLGEDDAAFTPMVMGGVELFGRGPVLMGILRIYGGGGVYGGTVLGAPDAGVSYTGGGHYGVEALVAERLSFAIEIGGQGPIDALGRDGGASVMAGSTFYFGDLKNTR